MQNIGEEIAGEYLKVIRGCGFVQYNFYTPDTQGEIDVVGIDIKTKTLYICEVATHLETGLQYTKNRQPDNVRRFKAKFEKNITYAQNHMPEYTPIFMLWSPIVKNPQKRAKHNQTRDLHEIQAYINEKHNLEIELVVNDKFEEYLQQLRNYALNETKELKSPVLRLMQIEEKLKKHLQRLSL